MPTRVSFEVSNAPALAKALGSASARKQGIEAAAPTAWHWSGRNRNGASTSLGAIQLEGAMLLLDTQSAERGERGRSLLDELAGEHLKHVSTMHQDIREQLRESITAKTLAGGRRSEA